MPSCPIERDFLSLEIEVTLAKSTILAYHLGEKWLSLYFTPEYSATDYTKRIFIFETHGTPFHSVATFKI